MAIYTLRAFALKNKEKGRWPNTYCSLRMLIYRSEDMAPAFLKIGGKWLVDEEAFNICIKKIAKRRIKDGIPYKTKLAGMAGMEEDAYRGKRCANNPQRVTLDEANRALLSKDKR